MSHKKFGPDRFSRFDVYWIQTNKQTDRHPDRQAKFIYRRRYWIRHWTEFPCLLEHPVHYRKLNFADFVIFIYGFLKKTKSLDVRCFILTGHKPSLGSWITEIKQLEKYLIHIYWLLKLSLKMRNLYNHLHYLHYLFINNLLALRRISNYRPTKMQLLSMRHFLDNSAQRIFDSFIWLLIFLYSRFQGTVKRNFNWPFMLRCQSLIHNGTLETFIWSLLWKILLFYRFKSVDFG